MLRQSLIQKLQFLNSIDLSSFKRVISYTQNLLLHNDPTLLHEIIEVSPQQGEELTLHLKEVFRALIRYRPAPNEMANELRLLRLDKQKTAFLFEHLTTHLYPLRKVCFGNHLYDQGIKQWRLHVEIANKSNRNVFLPKILMQFREEWLTSDYANLTNFIDVVGEAVKMHHNNKFKVARNSSV